MARERWKLDRVGMYEFVGVKIWWYQCEMVKGAN
jgi:hypothetical protein